MTYIRKKSQKQEKRTSKEFGGLVQIASGAIEQMKGDVRTSNSNVAGGFNTDDFLIENKFTDSKAYKLALTTWRKIAKEAFRDNFRTPLMQIDVQHVETVVFDNDLSKVMNLLPNKHIKVANLSYSMNVKEMEELFLNPLEVVLELDFVKTGERLYIMSKENFLSKLP